MHKADEPDKPNLNNHIIIRQIIKQVGTTYGTAPRSPYTLVSTICITGLNNPDKHHERALWQQMHAATRRSGTLLRLLSDRNIKIALNRVRLD